MATAPNAKGPHQQPAPQNGSLGAGQPQQDVKLHSKFTLWCMSKDGGFKANSFVDCIKKIGSFDSINGFWSYYKHITRPNDLKPKRGIDYHCFRDGIRPIWEDPANKNGGEWVLRMKKGVASRVWENMVLALLGGEFGTDDEICGIVMSVKPLEDKLIVWNKNGTNKEVVGGIRATIISLLNINPATNVMMDYVGHSVKIRQLQMASSSNQQGHHHHQGGQKSGSNQQHYHHHHHRQRKGSTGGGGRSQQQRGSGNSIHNHSHHRGHKSASPKTQAPGSYEQRGGGNAAKKGGPAAISTTVLSGSINASRYSNALVGRSSDGDGVAATAATATTTTTSGSNKGDTSVWRNLRNRNSMSS